MARTNFGSKLGVIAAAAGSAVGLGNIWRFPYEVGENGGAAFMIVYFSCILLIGCPIMLSEFVIGRMGQGNVAGSFRNLGHGKWAFIGYFGVVCSFLIMGFYSVVTGWTMEYIYQAVANNFAHKTTGELTQAFTDFSTQTVRPIFWAVICISITCYIVLKGVKKGIEQTSKFLMPLLLVLIMLLGLRSVTLPGGMDGLRFLFNSDFSKINSDVILSAMGQAFFSLSLGMGCMITYGSYISKKNNLMHTAFEVTAIDSIIATLSAIAIFPAVFAMGIDPAQGPQLVFITLPNIFTHIPGGYFWAILFFGLLTIAALTSTISLLEVVTAFFSEELKLTRTKSAILSSIIIAALSAVASLSIGVWSDVKVFGLTFFDLFDTLTAKYLMPIGGFMISVFCAWVLERKKLERELSNEGRLKSKFIGAYIFVLKYLIPIAIITIFLNELRLL